MTVSSRNAIERSTTGARTTPDPQRLYQGYRQRAGVYDEFMTIEGAVRPHWQAFVQHLGATTDDELASAWAVAERMLLENGVTHNVYGDPNDRDRLWPFDPIPLLIDAAEWRTLTTGLVQRAELLDAVVADLYGPQRLLAEGLIPADLVFGNPQYLRPLQGVSMPGDTHLHFIAFDLGRAPDGSWRILSDRTQAPVGAGYALENRIILSRTLADFYRNQPVQHVAKFFREFGAYLVNLSPQDEPLVVLLSPGPGSEAYFEHAYLARYLGITLVESADLTVRDNRVYLKTLSGLNPVHIILRRSPGHSLDPLELGYAADGGIPGLIRAIRAGNVILLNALGSGVVECDALQAYVPGLCRFLLGEDLKLPGIEGRWCGTPDGLEFVRQRFDDMVIRPTFSARSITNGHGRQSIPAEMDAAERRQLLEDVSTNPTHYVGQEIFSLSTAPAWSDGVFHSRPITLRVFVARSREGYIVMPGGLTRISDHTDPSIALLQQGDASKDTWILSDEPVDKFSRIVRVEQSLTPKRSAQDLPSRAADNLFWLGRYLERLEAAARLTRSYLTHLSDDSDSDDPNIALRLTALMVAQGHIGRNIQADRKLTKADIHALLTDQAPGNAPLNLLANVHRIANLVRERLSEDSWLIIQDLHDIAGRLSRRRKDSTAKTVTFSLVDGLRAMNQLIRLTAAFSGMQTENTTRGIGWRFLDMGRRLERARMTSRLIAGCAAEPEPAPLDGYDLELLLQQADSTMTYRTRYLSAPTPLLAIDLLLRDASNPRAITFQLNQLQLHFGALPREQATEGLSTEQTALSRLLAKIDLADLPALTDPVQEEKGTSAPEASLVTLFQTIEQDLTEISNILQQAYFSHAEPVQKSGPIWIGN